MNTHTTAISVLAALAFSMPMVCQAQDPLASLAKVKKMSAAGQTDEALKLCDTVMTRFGGKGATAQQFAYVLPYYAWEKGVIYFRAGRYQEAFDAFKAFKEERRWRDPAMLSKAKASSGSGASEAYEPFFTYSIFQMANCCYKLGVGEEGKNNGDKAKFKDAIKYFEEYLGLLQKGKVSATEKKQKLEGQVCFVLVQAYLMQTTPDFKKAAEYLEMSRKVKGSVPDEMAMDGLNTIVSVAVSNPENIGWVYKLIESNPASYNLSPDRAARNINKFYNLGQRAYKVMNDALRDGNDALAAEAVRTANALFGLVVDSPVARGALTAQAKAVGKYAKPVPDRNTGAQISGNSARKWNENIKGLEDKGMIFEAYSIMSSSTVAKDMGSNRLAKGGFQVLYDRYGRMTMPQKDKEPKEMKNTIVMQLGALNRMTGDEEKALHYEKMLEGVDMGDQTKVLVFQKMSRAVSDKNWEEVIPSAKEVIESFKNDKTNKLYLTARYMIPAAHYSLGQYDKVVETARELVDSGEMKSVEGKDTLKPEEAIKYDNDVFLFLVDSCSRLASQNPAMHTEAIKAFNDYAAKYTSTDLKDAPQADKMYYAAIDQHMKRAAAAADDKSADEDKKLALKYCDHICQNWPKSDLYPTAELLAAGILLNHTDNAVKATAMPRLEKAADAGVALNSKAGRATTANALFWLASYAAEYPAEGETEEAAQARARGYGERFWKDGDAEGDPFVLPMVAVGLNSITTKEHFDVEIPRAQKIIAREANYMFKNNKADAELEKTINTYVDSYVNGNKTYNDKTMTLEEKTAHFTSFPGIDPADKYTNAIFRMAQINSMNQELASLKDDKAAAEKMEAEIQSVFRNMTNTFKPADLTNYICVEVGDYLVRYVSKFPDPTARVEELKEAVAYYDAVIERKRDMVADAELGKANALAYSRDDAQKKLSAELYAKVAANPEPKVAAPALIGMTRLHLRNKQGAQAVESANKFLQNRQNQQGRLDMILMQGEAYVLAGDTKNALLAYMNLFNQYKGNVGYSARACIAIMDIFWKRNNPEKGDMLQKSYTHSDRWTAWNTGYLYVQQIKKSGVEAKLTPEDRDEFNKVVSAVHNYGTDAAVMKEDKAHKELQRNLNASKKKK